MTNQLHAQYLENFIDKNKKFFDNVEIMRVNMEHRMADDEYRAVVLDGISQLHLHMNFMVSDIVYRLMGIDGWLTSKVYKRRTRAKLMSAVVSELNIDPMNVSSIDSSTAFETMTFEELVEWLENCKELTVKQTLCVSFGVGSPRALMTMLKNLASVQHQFDRLVPFTKIKLAEPIMTDDVKFYNREIDADVTNTNLSSSARKNTIATLWTLMSIVPVWEVWRDKVLAMEKNA